MSESAIAEPSTDIEGAPAPINGSGGEPEITISEPGFGNLSQAFDQAFPSTAVKPEAASEAEPVRETPAAPAAPAAEKPAETGKDNQPAAEKAAEEAKFSDAVPDAVFGEKKADDPPAAAVEPKIETPAHIKDPKQIKNFEQMRDLYEGTKKELTRQTNEFARQLAEAKSAAVDPAIQTQIEQLTRQNQELLAAVERQNLQEHPQFKAAITIPREQAMAEARQLLTDAQLDPVQLEKAMTLTGAARINALEEIYEKLPEAAKAELAASVREVRRLDARREELLKNAHGNVEQLTRQDAITRHQRLQQEETQMLKMTDAAAEHLAEVKGFEAFKILPGDDPATVKWNEQVRERIADARALLTKTTDPAQHALAANLATACPFYRNQMLTYRTRALKAEKELAEIRGAEPRLDGGGGNGSVPKEDENLSFAESVARGSGLR